ncbi:cupin domain-containing protein [Labilibaculum sp. DW002]|uniref:Cupin domain-containing protein n=1 Tax=Paralabilibaculum antarcticum TaxID=2912572 RepID=A0ABT5VYR5_9BACT|nr:MULTISPECIES: cupin domain-containing protein [unclassified Labilibaculum]MBI9060052.1 cupin domain-containing protein [Labilibaculum sp.]MDE5420496.1 cupin domain-containing protein [Labilibaculum sp. DW002]|eukprot:TRINITY_DN31865_c0_g1_i1.p1 TRINITY_DN31865_c0_g1~~TRINITY_DN31865_c0_g1_i1.p1  ORF type:complete len:121 (-),score=16.36 TRINITY_DN31865_c0_g1_i1:348-710(-)
MKTNLLENFSKIKDYFSPKVIGEVNDAYVKIAKIKGDELPWHDHKNEDELFFIIEGNLLMEVEGLEPFEMATGDLYIVKKGTQHRVSSKEECKIMLIENKTTAHTGDVESSITKNIKDQL